MYIPTVGQQFTAANGTVWTVSEAAPDETDPSLVFITIVQGTDPDDIYAFAIETTNDQFEDICEAEGIPLR